MVVLVTGFEPNDDGINASEVLVKSLVENLPLTLTECRELLRFEVMPGNTNLLEDALKQSFQVPSPDFCLFTGQAPGRNKITIERIATNLKDFKTPDKAGNLPVGEKILPNGEAAYFSTISNLEELVTILEKNNIPAAISNYGGNHLCNQLLYHALHFGIINNLKIKSAFIHLPLLPEQVIKERKFSDSPFMPIEMTRMALSLIIKTILKS